MFSSRCSITFLDVSISIFISLSISIHSVKPANVVTRSTLFSLDVKKSCKRNECEQKGCSVHISATVESSNLTSTGCVSLASECFTYQASMNSQTSFFSRLRSKIQFKLIKMKVLPCWNEQAHLMDIWVRDVIIHVYTIWGVTYAISRIHVSLYKRFGVCTLCL